MENYIGDNIHAIRGNFGLSQEQLAAIAEVSQTSVSAWECGQTIPRFSNAVRIIESLPGLTMDDIYSQVLGYARRVLQQAQPDSGSSFGFVPLYGSIAAGAPIEMLQIEEIHPVPNTLLLRYPKAFYLRVKGESMNRVLPNGSYALVKRVRKLNNGIALEPDSNDPTYKPQVFDYGDGERETLSVIGRVVWFCVPYDYKI